MTTGLPAGWSATKGGLDQHETITALATALPETKSPGGGLFFDRQDVAEMQAAALGRAGYALVRVTDSTDFFSREED